LIMAYSFVMISGAVWLFVHLTFGFGTIKEAALITAIGAIAVALLQGSTPEIFAALVTIAGLVSMRIYNIRLAQAISAVVTTVFIGLFLFRFS